MKLMLKRNAKTIAGTLSNPSKMPCKSYSLPTHACKTGSKFQQVEGTVCNICYACQGMYQMKPVKEAMERRLRATKHDQWPDAMASLINGEQYFRWFDSGDIQSMKMLKQIIAIAKALPLTKFWLPTKEKALLLRYLDRHPEGFPENLIVRLSMMRVDPKRIPKYKHFRTCSTHLHKDPVGFLCPSESTNHQCGYCRACWDSSIDNIVYPARKRNRPLTRVVKMGLGLIKRAA